MAEQKPAVTVDEMARELAIPKYFLGKVMEKMVKSGVLKSSRGPSGGLSQNDLTLKTPLLRILIITDGSIQFEQCALALTKCDAKKPCALHHKIERLRNEMLEMFTVTRVGDLIGKPGANPDFFY